MATKKSKAKAVKSKASKSAIIVPAEHPIAAEKIPLGARIIASLFFAIALTLLVLGFAKLMESKTYVYAGLYFAVMLVLAALFLFMGLGVWRGKHWARFVLIVLAAIGILFEIGRILTGTKILVSFVWIAVYMVMGGYLLLSQEIKHSFR